MKRSKRKGLRWQWFQEWQWLVIAPVVTVLVLMLSGLGLLQTSEWAALDLFFRVRPSEPLDSRIVVVTISDDDITKIGQWPIPDGLLAKALSNLNAQRPRVIGLDLYRDLPVEPGHQELVDVFQSMPNLIGVQRVFGTQKVPPPKILAQLDRVADASIPEDTDKRVRRALLTGESKGQVYTGFGLAIALNYLKQEQITPEGVNGSSDTYQLGRVQFAPFRGDDGGYTHADDRGYQILLNFRGATKVFRKISFTDALNDRLPEAWIRDQVVLIGSSAESVKDIFLTPYSSDYSGYTDWTPGVLVHANIVSQILSAVIDGRPLLRGFPSSLKWLWTLVWTGLGVLVCWKMLHGNWSHQQLSYGGAILGILLISGGVVAIGYLCFLKGWWIPVAMPIVGAHCAAIACFGYHSYKLQRLAYLDGLTQVANRRYFDLYLAEQVYKRGSLALILCDVDCFKLYNDFYGHQAGDACLQQVARSICRAARRTDFVARYGGEEFAVVLPQTDAEGAALIAERILTQIRVLQLPHQHSTAANYVTLSCGVAIVEVNDQRLRNADWSGTHLIDKADKTLYRSKENGRDRYTLERLI